MDAEVVVHRAVEARQPATARAEPVRVDTDRLRQRQQEVSPGLRFGVLEPAPRLDPGVLAAGQDDRQVTAGVIVPVLHARPEHQDRVVEQSSVSLGNRGQAADQVSVLLEMPLRDAIEVRDVPGATVAHEVREVVVLLVDAEKIEDDPAAGVRHQERDDPRGVGPECEHHHVQKRLDSGREVRGDRGPADVPLAGRLPTLSIGVRRLSQLLLDAAHRFEVRVEPGQVGLARPAAQAPRFRQDGIQHRQVPRLVPAPSDAAKHTIEDDLRIALARHGAPPGIVGDVAGHRLRQKDAVTGHLQ